MDMNFAGINKIFQKAEKDGRSFLFEHEVYQVLKLAGIQTPKFRLVRNVEEISQSLLRSLGSPRVVVKVVSPQIVHKSDVGGVRIVRAELASVRKTIGEMLAEVPGAFLKWEKKFRSSNEKERPSAGSIREGILGFLILEKVEFAETGFGAEILLGIRNSREFGPVVTMGIGGTEVEYMSERLKAGRAQATTSAHLVSRKHLLSRLEGLAFFEKVTGEFRGRKALIGNEEVAGTFYRFARLAALYSPFARRSPYVIEEAEVNPFVIRKERLVPLDGMCRFSRNKVEPKVRPYENLDFLLHPKTIGIIGVSEKMNIGHAILRNILGQGFPRENVYVVKPGAETMEGCRCFPSLADLPAAVDLFVLTLAIDQSFEILKEIIKLEKTRSTILIASGLGEKKGKQDLETDIRQLLENGRNSGRPTPLLNGGNCMGIFSKPGLYDSTFVPEYKLPRPKGIPSSLVYISQSGAFIATRMSHLQKLEPLYGISLGNQTDLTASDYLSYFKDNPQARIFAVYMEGFQPADGFLFARAAREIIAQKGKMIVVYKAGRSPEGRAATSSHTASVAGDYAVARAVLEEAGAFIAEDIFEFENAVKGLCLLDGKKVRGRRVALVSNAGFECVIMADNLKNDEELKPAEFSRQTVEKISKAIAPLGIDRLQDVHNPLDLTPVADDAVFAECVAAMITDENVDCLVVSPVPMTPSLQTLEGGGKSAEDIRNAESVVMRLVELFRKTDKPIVISADAGSLYDPMADLFEESGIPVFRRSDEAVRFLRKYVNVRLRVRKLFASG